MTAKRWVITWPVWEYGWGNDDRYAADAYELMASGGVVVEGRK